MNFEFDLWGWYVGQHDAPGARTTTVAPANLSTSVESGKPRSNWSGVGWVEVPYVVPPEPAEPEPPAQPRRISVGAFFDRFGNQKWSILADPAPQVQAVIKDASVRVYIDLDRTDLPMGLAVLIDAGHAIDAQAILTAPVQPHEVP